MSKFLFAIYESCVTNAEFSFSFNKLFEHFFTTAIGSRFAIISFSGGFSSRIWSEATQYCIMVGSDFGSEGAKYTQYVL